MLDVMQTENAYCGDDALISLGGRRRLREAGFTPRVAATPDLETMVMSIGLNPLPEPANPENGS